MPSTISWRGWSRPSPRPSTVGAVRCAGPRAGAGHRLAPQRAAARQLGDGRVCLRRRAARARRVADPGGCRAPHWPGKAWQGAVGPGQCVKIMTGAIMPAGHGHGGAAGVHRSRAARAASRVPPRLLRRGDNRRLKGEDLRKGQPALRKRRRLTPAALRTGRQPGARVGGGASPAARGLLLHRRRNPEPGRAAARRRGVRQQPLHGVRPAQAPGLRSDRHGRGARRPGFAGGRLPDAAAKADAIITSGGVSVGEADYTKAMMKKLGDVAFWRIAMRPGRRWRWDASAQTRSPFGLPGNPGGGDGDLPGLRAAGPAAHDGQQRSPAAAAAGAQRRGHPQEGRAAPNTSAAWSRPRRWLAASAHHRQPGFRRAQLHGRRPTA